MRPIQRSASGAKRGRPGEPLFADGLAVQVELDSRGRVEGRRRYGSRHRGEARRSSGIPATFVRGELQPEPAFGIDPEEESGLAVLFLVDDRAPRPGIGLKGDPGFDGEGPVEAGRLRGGADDGRRLPVETEGLAGHAGDEFVEAPDLVTRPAP